MQRGVGQLASCVLLFALAAVCWPKAGMPFRTRAAACRHTVEDPGNDLQEISRNDRSAALLLWATYETLGVTCRHEVGLADSHHHSAVFGCERPHAGALAGGHAVPQRGLLLPNRQPFHVQTGTDAALRKRQGCLASAAPFARPPRLDKACSQRALQDLGLPIWSCWFIRSTRP